MNRLLNFIYEHVYALGHGIMCTFNEGLRQVSLNNMGLGSLSLMGLKEETADKKAFLSGK